MRARLLAGLAGPAGPLWVALIALLLVLPSASLPRAIDDHGFRRRLVVERGGLNAAFEFVRAERDQLRRRGPWYFDPAPAPERRFLRPVSGATHWLDHRLWPDAVWWMRIENCLLYAALAALAALGYRRLGLPGSAAALAALLFAVDEAHAHSLSMVAGRNTLLSAALGLCALLAHHAQARAPSRFGRGLGPFWFVLALLAGEGGLATLAYLAAYAICIDRRPAGERIRSLLAYPCIALPWAVAYLRGGYGAADGRFYRDPIGAPLATLVEGALDLPTWIASQLTLGFATPALEFQPGLVRLVALAILLPLAWLLWPTLRDRPAARFFALGGLLALVPLMLTVPQDRLLVLASFGAFGLLGQFLVEPAAYRPARIGLFAIHLGLAPLAFVPSYLLASSITRAEDKVERALPRGARAAATDVVLVRAPIPATLGYALAKRGGLGQPLPRTSYELLATGAAVEIARLDARTLELTPRGGWCRSRAECLGTRSPTGFRIGQTFALLGMRATIRELTPRGTPQRVRFEFPSPLEDPARRWLTWTPRGVEPFALPAVHGRVTLPALSALSALR